MRLKLTLIRSREAILPDEHYNLHRQHQTTSYEEINAALKRSKMIYKKLHILSGHEVRPL